MGRTVVMRLLETYFRHRWLYLLPIVLAIACGAYYLAKQERYYISNGLIFTEQAPLLSSLTSVNTEGFSWNTPAQDTANQISDLIRSDAFVRAVIGMTDLEAEMSKGEKVVEETITDVRERLWVNVAGVNQVQINAANVDPQIAHQLAQATITTFLQWKINLDQTDSATASVFFQDLIASYKADVVTAQQALKSYLETHPQPVRGDRPDTEQLEIQNLKAELDFAGTRLSNALDKAENARLAETQAESTILQKYTMVDAPDIPTKPAVSKRKLAMNGAVFLVVGVLVSMIAVIGATVLERSFRLPADIHLAMGLPVLAAVPDVTKKVRRKLLRRKTQAPAPEVIPASEPDIVLETDEPEVIQPDTVEGEPIPVDLRELEIQFKTVHKVSRSNRGSIR